jgi:hypothetical protein
MGRRAKPFERKTPSCPTDDDFFRQCEKALGIAFPDNAIIRLGYLIAFTNETCVVNEQGGCRLRRSGPVGRLYDPTMHIFVDGVLEILETELGIVPRVSKRPSSRNPMSTRISAFMRVVWDALELPDRDANGLAGLVANSGSWLGANVEERRQRRAKHRRPRDEYLHRTLNAWKNRPASE